jgi:cysteine synthase A
MSVADTAVREPVATPSREGVLSLIGNTPLLPLFFREAQRTIFAKCEYLNPSGSIKDRLAQCVLLDALRRGALRPDSVILEVTSGNTGISLAMVGAALGLRVKILMSDTASVERRYLMHHFGAEVALFKAEKGYTTGLELADKLAASDPRYFLPRQFENPINALDHQEHTGPELLAQLDGDIDAFVAGYGTGGTLSGVGKALRAANPAV